MTTLVFSGSASLYPAHFGAAARLASEPGLVFDHFVGTSGGAIVAAWLAAGNSASKGLDLAMDILPRNVIAANWSRFFTRRSWGLFTLTGLEKEIRRRLPTHFIDLAHGLTVVTADVATRRPRIFSRRESPGAEVAKVVVASCSVPGLFRPLTMGPSSLLVDGGLVNNFALDMAPVGMVIGVRVHGLGSREPKTPKNAIDFAAAAMETVLTAAEDEHVDEALEAKIIEVDVPWHAFDFWRVDAEVVKNLYESGWVAADRALKNGGGG